MTYVWVLSSDVNGILGVYSSEKVARAASPDIDWESASRKGEASSYVAFPPDEELTLDRYPVQRAQ